MPKKPGNGGHGPEEYDVNTGKYVADGQPNKYYDNPKEKNNINIREKLENVFGKIFDNKELEAKINAMFETQKAEKYTKNIEEMSQEELLSEIGEHKQYLIDKGINLSQFVDAFNYDLKLKCANFREMHRLMEKYPINLKGCEFINSHAYHFDSSTNAYMAYYRSFSRGFIPNTIMNFNAKYFVNYDYVKNEEKRLAQEKWHHECGDDLYSSYTFIHEYGHAIFHDIVSNWNIFSRDVLDDIFEKKLSEINIVDRFGRTMIKYRNELYTYSEQTAKNIAQRLTVQEIDKMLKNQAKKVHDEVFAIFSEQNSDILNKREFFANEVSGYAKSYSKVEGKYSFFEWFAETFASLEGGKPTKSALALGEWLKRNGYMKGA
jgi:hypothetical protein